MYSDEYSSVISFPTTGYNVIVSIISHYRHSALHTFQPFITIVPQKRFHPENIKEDKKKNNTHTYATHTVVAMKNRTEVKTTAAHT